MLISLIMNISHIIHNHLSFRYQIHLIVKNPIFVSHNHRLIKHQLFILKQSPAIDSIPDHIKISTSVDILIFLSTLFSCYNQLLFYTIIPDFFGSIREILFYTISKLDNICPIFFRIRAGFFHNIFDKFIVIINKSNEFAPGFFDSPVSCLRNSLVFLMKHTNSCILFRIGIT